MEETIMTSTRGTFELQKHSGIGMNNTPHKELRVVEKGDADKYVVHIRFDWRREGDYNLGIPVVYIPKDVEVTHGVRMMIDTLEDTMRYIKVLEEALDFAIRIKGFIETGEAESLVRED